MKLLVTALVFLLVGCSTAPSREELAERQDLSMKQYEDCLRVSTNHYLELARGTATEVAEAVFAEFDYDLERVRRTREAIAMTTVESAEGKEEAVVESQESVRHVRDGMHGEIIGRVLREG